MGAEGHSRRVDSLPVHWASSRTIRRVLVDPSNTGCTVAIGIPVSGEKSQMHLFIAKLVKHKLRCEVCEELCLNPADIEQAYITEQLYHFNIIG